MLANVLGWTYCKVTVSVNRTEKEQVCFKHDTSGVLDLDRTHATPLFLLWMKDAKEARFLTGAAIVIKDDEEDIIRYYYWTVQKRK